MWQRIPKIIHSNLLWTEGRFFLGIMCLGQLGFLCTYWCLSTASFKSFEALWLISTTFFLYFYRNPCRSAGIDNPFQLLCPADGRIMNIEHITTDNFTQRISIFLSPLDVHVQWTPMAGNVKDLVYKKGSFSPAFFQKSEHNECNEIILEGNYDTIAVRQIAGILARRISCWVKTGDALAIGQKYGMIHFGSRVDILVPKNVHITVQKGQRVRGGLTQLGVWQCS